ncbi:N-6 DNA methylase [Curtobacterium sp. 1310]|uniref:N-6 DNA methylase n=1 Tax=Curtobacterium sp. 1310 TaxID=2806570 RepID=UPI001AE9DC51|nr:N-6 DNA methylase [Curtobacterium sp. 1310]MBP1303002.1 type I restriction enzyme M protein [Curtobacterium sp. 1310]
MPNTPPDSQTTANWLGALNFVQQPGTAKWVKTYPGGFAITVNTAGPGTIDYGVITIGRATTTNLLSQENLVVLECVDLLIGQIGYPADALSLEKAFHLGRGDGGYLDILVHRGEKAYLMVEVKTAGDEYDSELRKLKTRPQSQLMSYLHQDRDAEQALLYSSRLIELPSGACRIERTYAGFPTRELIGTNLRALFGSWDKQTYTSGLEESSPYSLRETRIKVADLRDMEQQDGSRLFNQFEEILRRHAVSDKPNAFNKLFNLFICKVADESKRIPSQDVDFQWMSTETEATVLERLSQLYAKGMRQYLSIEVDDGTEARLEASLQSLPADKQQAIRELFIRSRQFRNNEFAFVDVFDSQSYLQNAEIVREIVRLLQKFRLRYSEKHGFLGLFFEKLLNTSMKQESGQFFTPPPIAQFINESLPIERMIESKIAAGDTNFLPYAIDYAAGSGHFLTEYMARTDRVLKNIPDEKLQTEDQLAKRGAWNRFQWAGEFVYGIELDYRLAKAAKVSTFLNGDGQAHIIRGNGLGHFETDLNYRADRGILTRQEQRASLYHRDLARFDIVIGNPPFSVSDFLTGVEAAEESFELASGLSDRSDKIEALFVERTKHLLKDGGVAGIILPSSFLSNSGVEARARRLLIEHFEVLAIVSLGGSVFIATSTPTSILFLRRRSNATVANLKSAISAFMSSGTDTVIMGIADGASSYAIDVHGLTLEQYVGALKDPMNKTQQFVEDLEWEFTHRSGRTTSPRVEDPAGRTIYSAAFVSTLRASEAQRMEAYFLTRQAHALHVQAPSGTRDERKFLGYKFSDRKQHEGIAFLSPNGRIETPLFDPEDSDNATKLSTLIKARFEDKHHPIPATLSQYAQDVACSDLVGISDPLFTWSLSGRPSTDRPFKTSATRMGAVATIAIGGTPSRERPDYFGGDLPWVAIRDMNGGTVEVTEETLSEIGVQSSNAKLVKAGTLLLSFKLTIGRTAIAGRDLYTNEAIAAVSPREQPNPSTPWVDTAFLHELFRFFAGEILAHGDLGSKKIGKSLNMAYLRRVRIPLLPEADRVRFVKVARSDTESLAARKLSLAKFLWE